MAGYSTTSAPVSRPRRDITRRTRAVRSPSHAAGPTVRVALVLLMVAASVAAVAGHGPAASGVDTMRFETIAVAEGGSLWEIAARYPVPGLDTPDTVALIRTANRLETSVVHVGQTIRVPAQGPVGTSVASR